MRLAVFVCVETWLNGDIPNSVVEIPGFTMVRGTDEHSGKRKGEGLAILVNSKW